MTATKKEPRKSKTPYQRAAETVKVLERRLERIRLSKDKLETQHRAIIAEEKATQARLDYARTNPDLQELVP